MNTITLEQVMHWSPCHSREDILKMSGGKTEMTVLELLRLETVTPKDKLWVVLRVEVLGEKLCIEAGCRCAEHVLHYYEDKYPGDMRPRNGIEAARRYARGEITIEELNIARVALQAAADAAWGAAWGAAWAAAWAVPDAAWNAARAAVWAADRDAADAAWAAECQWQVEMLIKLLEEAQNG